VMEDAELPPDWAWATLQDVGQIISGGTPKTSDPANFDGDIPWITPADLTGYVEKTISRGRRNITKKGLESSSARIVPKRSVVFSSRAPIGYVAVAANELTTNQGFKSVAVSDQIDETFVYFYLKSAKHLAEEKASGTTFKEISGSRFAQLLIPVAPLNEQRRIVEKIETLFARLDKGEEALSEVQKLLARYRQSVLKAAVTGQLTADWRAENAHRLEHGRDLLARILQTRRENWNGRGKYKEPVAPDTSDLPELPDGWVWASVDQLLRAGLTNGRSVPDATEGFPVLRLTALKDGRIDLSERKIGAWDAAAAEPFLIERGDVVVSRGNGSKHFVGRGGLVEEEPDSVAYPDTMIRIPLLLDYLSPRWFLQLWNSPFMRSQIERAAKTTAGIYKINQTDIRNFRVPLPPLTEQEEVAALVNEHMSKITHLESLCETELVRSGSLRQSILKDAFAGRLVPQDTADEPAADLLARIKQSRAAAPDKPRRKATA